MFSHHRLFYSECFGNEIEQETFYREQFLKTSRTYSVIEERDARIRIAVSLPPGSIPTSDMRRSLKAAAKMPYTHRGGRPRWFEEDEIPSLWKKVLDLKHNGNTWSRAIREIAELEGADPRTLKAEFIRAGYMV